MLDQDRDHYPKQANKTVNWEKVFTDPKDGLITLVSSVNNKETLLKVFEVTLNFLYIRDGDAGIKDRHFNELNTFIQDKSKSFEGCLSLSMTILNFIKNERIEIANNYDPDADQIEPEQIDEGENVIEKAVIQKEKSALEKIIVDDYKNTLKTIEIEDYDGSLGELPFILSSTFHDNFLFAFEQFSLNSIAAQCEEIGQDDKRHQKDYEKALENKTLINMPFREIVWDSWRQNWEIKLRKKHLPKKPDRPSGVGVVGNLFSKKHEQAQADWGKRSSRIKKHNKKISDFQDSIIAENATYSAPNLDDIMLLIKTFGMTRTVFEKQINGIIQIITQNSDNPSATFDQFTENRNLDISLLYVFFKDSSLITGKTNHLNVFMRSYKESMIKSKFPYTHKYLKDFMF